MSYRPATHREDRLGPPTQVYRPAGPPHLENAPRPLFNNTPTRSSEDHIARGDSSRSATTLSSPPSQKCDVCFRTDVKTYTCIQCNSDNFCSSCWDRERAHRPGAVGFDGKPHEKTDKSVVERLKQILEPKRSAEEQMEGHMRDEDTTWFGIVRDAAGAPVLKDYERFAGIMEESRSTGGVEGVRYPQLVSFVGQTGAGKSTLIKMLIDHTEGTGTAATERFPSPVSGDINDNVPTSGDVHLYSDPASYYSSTPMLYADCEGLDGGENIPRGARYKQRERSAGPSTSPVNQTDPGKGEKSRKLAHRSQRDLSWATTPETRKREYAVTQLYPRLLYTFSDVVVFVLRNSKIFESVVLELLLNWASASIEKSLNQPALPHMIIALNASDLSLDERQWSVEDATRTLMSDIEGAITRVPRFAEYADMWRETGREIRTTKDLLECYYASVTVVRIPSSGRYMLMNEQISKLHFEITKCCQVSFWTKKRVRMLSSDEKLQVFLQSAFDHFSQNLNTPFDFVKEAVRNNPIPRDFGGNILKLAIAVRDHHCFGEMEDGKRIWAAMSMMVASCLMLNSARECLLGSITQLLEDVYADLCEEALENFCNMYWPCSFQNEYGRCYNMRSGHNPKGHQNRAGKIIAAGKYCSPLNFENYADTWIYNISYHLEKIQKEVYSASIHDDALTEAEAAARVHCKTMNDFYRNVGDNVYAFVSHGTCFSCLRELPEHALPCGHVLCTACIKSYGRRTGRATWQLEFCPLHVIDTEFAAEFPRRVSIKPVFAGTRILSLDGGGVRGISQLEMLRAIERQLGGELPIQAFFDLIVGTGTAGIIALGLGVENWSVEKCVIKFNTLCEQAYTPREFVGIPLLGKLAAAHHRSMYKTRPFEKVLQKEFDDRPLFGGVTRQEGQMLKVAVTATTLVGQRPVVLANYNRPDGVANKYTFERQDKPDLEMRSWEAARATSACSPYFKSFIKNETKVGYTDGAVYHNNPVAIASQERTLIWRDVGQQPPDIFLSLGTGFYDQGCQDDIAPIRRSGRGTRQNSRGQRPSNSKTSINQSPQTVGTLDCSEQWKTFHNALLRDPHNNYPERYMRLNPDLGFPVPKPDSVTDSPRLSSSVIAYTKLQAHARIKEIAHRLLASTFFFEKFENSMVEKEDGMWECDGTMCCRFSNDSEELRSLGRFLHTFNTPLFVPHFVIQETGDMSGNSIIRIPFSNEVIRDMCVRGRFNIGTVHLCVTSQMSATDMSLCLQAEPYFGSSIGEAVTGVMKLPVSGFPRCLMMEVAVTKPDPAPASTATKTANSQSAQNRYRRRRAGHGHGHSGSGSSSLQAPQFPSHNRPRNSSDHNSVSSTTTSNLLDLHPKDGPRVTVTPRRVQTGSFPDSPEDVRLWVQKRRDEAAPGNGNGNRDENWNEAHPGVVVPLPVFELDGTGMDTPVKDEGGRGGRNGRDSREEREEGVFVGIAEERNIGTGMGRGAQQQRHAEWLDGDFYTMYPAIN